VGKEFAILIAVHLATAELNCPLRIEQGRLSRLLEHHGLSIRDAFTVARSPELQAEIARVRASFQEDWERACDAAVRSFGPGAPFGGYLLPR
jgi:hypothetical protein